MTKNINEYFDEIYLINLPRKPDKLTKVLYGLNRYKIKVRIVRAEDGYHPKHYYDQGRDQLPAGAYGYVKTYQRIINHALQRDYEKILVLDDDVILHHDFDQLFQHFIQQIDNRINWKILLLGASQHVKRPPLIDGLPAYHPRITDGSFATGIHKSCFEPMLSLLRRKNLYLDSHILRYFYENFTEQCVVFFPNLIIADVSQSDIRGPRSQKEIANKFDWNLSSYHYPLKAPTISLIIPCYQAEKTIQRCLHSVLHQTYRPLEVIIVEDGSRDRTFQLICETVQKWEFHKLSKDLNIRMIKHHKNLGAYQTRNDGIKASTGEFIAFQDSDDISSHFRLEMQLNSLLEKQVKVTTCLILRTHLTELSYDEDQLKKDILATSIHHNKYCCSCKIGLVTTLFSRSVIDEIGLYRADMKWGADAEYLRRLFPNLDPNYQIMNYLNEVDYLPDLYYRCDTLAYFSYEMTDQNLTAQRLKELIVS